MLINRLRLLGFKSFVEPTELVIEKGLTGVVGPNGCGKSNLLEALRWVMGETSYKSMRASAMEDVIFSGTNNRPPRNWAEVTIFLDNTARTAPAEFNDSDLIEITRRIERDVGSAYRINSSEARARDIKILFEDAATGARSPALVRQGQIGEIVNAKPEQRRRILEDAAGVAGLHSRRHDAELRLKAAETNLARVADVLGQLSSQVESLKRQARQARRYKELSGEIRKAEALLAHLTWTEAQTGVDAEETALNAVLERLGAATRTDAEAQTAELAAAEAIQPLRDGEATRAAVLQRLRIERDNFEREAERLAERQRELEARAVQLTRDLEREEGLVAEAQELLARAAAESEALTQTAATAAEQEAKAKDTLTGAEANLAGKETALRDITAAAAEERARRRSLEDRHKEMSAEIERLTRALAETERQLAAVAARAPDIEKLKATTVLGQQLAEQIQAVEADALAAEERTHEALAGIKGKREAAQAARLQARQLETEVATLSKLLRPAGDMDWPPVVDQVKVAPGFEMALGAALGDDLDAPTVAASPVRWDTVRAEHGDDPPLPPGIPALIAHVEAPPALARRLRQIGIVPRAEGARLQPMLRAGQRLVSIEGDLWRWDGYVAAADAPTAAAQRLAERNRLAAVEIKAAEATAKAEELVEVEHEAMTRHQLAEGEERRLRQLWRDKQSELARTRETLTGLEKQARETESRLGALGEAKTRTETALTEARRRLEAAAADLAALGEADRLAPALAAAEQAAQTVRAAVANGRAEVASLERERRQREERIAHIASERARWQSRVDGAGAQIAALEQRRADAMAEIDKLAGLPALVAEKRQKLMNELADAERQRQEAADALAAAETRLRAAAQALKAAQDKVAEEREGRARTEARLEGARQRRSDEARKIRESLGCDPDGCLAIAEVVPGAYLAPLPEVERQLTRLKGDRERLGGVNLQADEELTRLSEQHAGLDKERADLEEAIAKLRGGIGQLNREAKARLMEAFTVVDGHFQRLFTTLFGGGEARLEMIEGEDPMEGGLEIIAKPPGKKPATLSLLSGGEQTLTALSLIFAVFLTNPSPICVLDEVDAPLDDSNVDRFCTLMERMASETETRFLVITHHPMTMARMHRLFGVTMAEKGVSQLVSVDLATAERIIEEAPQQQGAA